MSNFDDEWMNDPLEMDDWIREMEEDTKGVQPKRGGRPPGGGGCGSGCLTVFLVVLAVTIIIAVVVTVFSPT